MIGDAPHRRFFLYLMLKPKEGLHKCSPKMLAEYRRGCDDLIDETN